VFITDRARNPPSGIDKPTKDNNHKVKVHVVGDKNGKVTAVAETETTAQISFITFFCL
jgi:hypothetical protein